MTPPERGRDGLREAVEALYREWNLTEFPDGRTRLAEAEWLRRVLTDSRFRVGSDVRREELIDVLAAHVAQAKEGAWDEGYCHAAESICDDRPSSTGDNPYRADRIEGTR